MAEWSMAHAWKACVRESHSLLRRGEGDCARTISLDDQREGKSHSTDGIDVRRAEGCTKLKNGYAPQIPDSSCRTQEDADGGRDPPLSPQPAGGVFLLLTSPPGLVGVRHQIA
jgi:hypothetical protein